MGLGVRDDSPVAEALWAGDVDRLHDLAPCRCCCSDHTFETCEARKWGGCRGQNTPTRDDLEGWAAHYKMPLDQFLGSVDEEV
jgi:hypothetical protein